MQEIKGVTFFYIDHKARPDLPKKRTYYLNMWVTTFVDHTIEISKKEWHGMVERLGLVEDRPGFFKIPETT